MLGILPCSPMGTSVHHLSVKQGWTSTPVQLPLLECILCHGAGTCSKQKIKVVVKEVIPHGQISETKVYDWVSIVTDTASPSEEKTTLEIFQVQHNFAPGDGAMLMGYPTPYNKHENQSLENAGFAPYRLPPIQNQPNPSIIQAHGFQGLRSNPMTSVAQHSLAYGFVETFGNAERYARHEKKICEFLMSGSSGKEQEGLDLSHLSNLMSLEAINICMPLQYATRTDFRAKNSIMLKPSLFYLSGNRCSQKHLENLVDDFHCHSAVSVNTDGHAAIIGTMADMKNWASILAELYFLKESARQRKQTMLVPYFRWTNIKENQTDIFEFSLKL
ncbi:hypothetical protein Nepgr_012703 [Nepenthes gracilis]|uniref:Uncharacterized protein n=1 Tax=Nepenthes gracilis TaxID=150966 RepID=A0AAD3SHS1_NEPGR|nr:hypothetical protein Nepgr_012703 [Nepenthes gracilis]